MHGIGLENIFWFPMVTERKEINSQLMLFPVHNAEKCLFQQPERGHTHEQVCCIWWFISTKFLYLHLWLSFYSALLFRRISELEQKKLAIGHSLLIKINYVIFQIFPFMLMLFGNIKHLEKYFAYSLSANSLDLVINWFCSSGEDRQLCGKCSCQWSSCLHPSLPGMAFVFISLNQVEFALISYAQHCQTAKFFCCL